MYKQLHSLLDTRTIQLDSVEIEDLVQASTGWHFSAQQAALGDIEDFAWESMTRGFTSLTPLIISIMMHSTNRKANRFQSILGIFLHSVGTPQKVISALSRMGVCIGQTTIYDAINSLSDNAADGIRELGQTLLAAYAYDNFDVDLKHSVPVIEKSNQTLKHLTSGLLFPLQHGATKEDLACSDYLWERSKLNPKNSRMAIGMKTYRQLEIPELLEAIPVKKTDIIPAYAMDVNNSTVNGNIRAIEQLMAQGGVGSPDDEDTVDISKYVALVHGDLGTGKRIKSLMNRRAIEDRAWECFQYVKFCLGLFHTKMACVDVLWRIFIKDILGKEDETSLMKDVGVIRAKQTGTIKSKCEFRRMHQVIQHVGAVRRLDCWRIAVQKLLPSFTSLEEFAKSKPKLDELKTMAEKLVSEFVANHRISTQFKNAALMQQYFLLYEELTFATVNHGDITRFEKVLLPWIQLFKATGKHIYATEMTEFLLDTHFMCPERLQHVIRYNILINPTGKPGKFRAVDWCVELHNYYIKVKYGGQGSNRSVKRMISESALVGTYSQAHETIEKTMHLNRLTTGHADPDMRKTFAELRNSLSQCSPHIFTPGRATKYSIPDML
ncbi:hypothetical protein F5887DRAFT_1063039 [Amanita rubescens]|nr:hypothetical protein F5887DRAFT_1063039 [Amanita rubescens]